MRDFAPHHAQHQGEFFLAELKNKNHMPYRFLAVFLISGLVFGCLALPTKAALSLPQTYSKTAVKKPVLAVKKKATPPKKVPRRLDGVMVPPAQANKWPVAVMIDEHPAGRPQSGLSKASVVYESLAEGGIPRFMAIFANVDALAYVGPVRSTRPYFVRYAAEYNAAMVHAGGSPDALNMIKRLRLVNIEGIKGPFAKYFFRAFGGGVHGLYTSGANLVRAIRQARHDKRSGGFPGWNFVNDAPMKKRPRGLHGATIDLGYGAAYKIRYTYDRAKNSYLRNTGYFSQRDRNTGQPIAVKNVIMLVVPKEKILDKKGRLDLHTLGIDKGVLLQNGKAKPITWKKMNDRARTIFRDLNGKEISLIRGNTWITVVPRGHKYSLF